MHSIQQKPTERLSGRSAEDYDRLRDLFGLLPIMWSPTLQAGADVMKRIATPMVSGVVTSAILELLIYPTIYVLWLKRELPDQTEEQAPLIPPALISSERMRQRLPRACR